METISTLITEAGPWFAPFVVRDIRGVRCRTVELVFPLGLGVDANGFAELARAFPGASVRWSVREPGSKPAPKIWKSGSPPSAVVERAAKEEHATAD